MRARALIGAVALVTAGACSSSSSPATTAPPGSSVTVFAAASLTAAFNNAKSTLPGISLTFNVAGSNTLVTQIAQGAPAEVFASADNANMAKLAAAGLVATPVTFARNKLQIAVAAGNPRNITGVADLARPGVTVVLVAPGVPAGDYTRHVLAEQQVTVSPKSLETDVKSALSKVTSGEADATVVYVTDVIAGGPAVAGIAIADALQPAITYPIAVVKTARNPAAAQAFVDSAVSGTVQKSLRGAGFLPPA